MDLRDRAGRPLRSLRLSVTDRCNLRCRYCMPGEHYSWLPRTSILSFEETARLAGLFMRTGVRKLRLTGGEPLLRQDLPDLVAMLSGLPGLEDLALTTNGVLLEELASPLRRAGLGRVTVSLDTLQPERMREFAKSSRHGDVLRGIRAARVAGFGPVKLNCVVIRGFNDDELEALVEFGRAEQCEVRFIEYMDVGGASGWKAEDVVSRREILGRLEQRFGPASPVAGADPSAPAERFRFQDGTTIGMIASTTEPFCRSCDRGRLTADGHFYLCLYAVNGIDLLSPMRAGESDDDLIGRIRSAWSGRDDRGAELRAALPDRGVLFPVAALRADPHKEMHTRGG